MVVALLRGEPLVGPPGAASQLRAWASLPIRSTVSPHHSPRRCDVENSKQLRTGGAEGISTSPPPHLAMMLPMPRTSSSPPFPGSSSLPFLRCCLCLLRRPKSGAAVPRRQFRAEG